MQIAIRKGITKLSLTKPERKVLAQAHDILKGIEVVDNTSGAREIGMVLERIDNDGVYTPPNSDEDE